MTSYGPEKWGTNEIGPQGYKSLGDLSQNLNGLSIIVPDQNLCLLEVGLPFLDSSNFTPTFDMFSRTLYFGGGFQMEYSKIYS